MDGILVLAKPPGPTSHDMVALVRRLSGTRRVGHGGTLDPFAAGVLPIFLGKATRLVEFHLGAVKRYRATVCFGASSTTDDLEGDLTPVDAGVAPPTRESVQAALALFRGEVSQRPPAYSAIKIAGRRAYAMARAGETPHLTSRTVTIHELTLMDWDGGDPARPVATIEVTCSAGTYIRALARDLAGAVGNAAYLGALTRTASGAFALEAAIDLDGVRQAAAAGGTTFAAVLRPIDDGLPPMPEVRLSAAEREAVVRGQFIRPATGIPHGVTQESPVRLVDATGALVALGRVRGGRIAPDKVLVDAGTGGSRSGETSTGAAVSSSAMEEFDRAVASANTADPVGTVPSVGASQSGGAHRAMHLVAGLNALTAGDGPLFAVVGVFDGLHRGHLYLLDRLRSEAARRDAWSGVITFDAHPDEILTGAAPPIVCDPEERLVRLAAAGVDVTVVQHFDRALRMTSYQDFIEMITRGTRLAGLLMTPDAALGHERQGTPEALAALGADQGWEVVVAPPFQIAGRDIRSADIRSLIAVGDLEGGAALLGRPYAVTGDRPAVEEGSSMDTDVPITFPMPVALPPSGTYEGTAEVAWRRGAADVVPRADLAVAGPATRVVIRVPTEPGSLRIRAAGDDRIPAGARLRVTFSA